MAQPLPALDPLPGLTPLPGQDDPPVRATLDPIPGLSQASARTGLEPVPGLQPLPGTTQTRDPNAPWYSRAWNWANTPLVDLHRQGATGIEAGLEDVGSSLTTPLSIALTVGTFGSGAALRALGIGATELPLVVRGARALMSAGLTGTQVAQVVQESPRVLDALKEGDYDTAKRLAVHVAAGTAFAAFGGRAAAKDIYSPTGVFRPAEQSAALRNEFGKYQADVESGNRTATLYKQSLENALPKGTDRGAIYRYITAGGDPAKLVERYNAIAESAGRDKLPAPHPHDTSPDAVIKSQGLVYKGELTGGSAVHQFEHPAHPGITAALNANKTPITPEAVTEKMAAKLREFGIDEPLKPQPLASEMDPALRDLAARKLLADASPKYVDGILDEYRRAMDLDPKERAIADKIRGSYAEDFERAHAAGVINAAVRDYANRIWEQPNEASRTITNQASNGRFSGNVSMARHRVFESEVMGEVLGHKLVSTDPVELSAWNKATISKAVAARDFLDRLRDSGLRASDGRPMVALSGTGEPVLGDEAATLVNPFKTRNIRIPDAMIQSLQQSGDLQRFVQDGTVVERKSGGYSWATGGDYQTINHPAFRNWAYATDAPDGSPVFVKGELRAHPEVVEQLKRYIGAEQPLLGQSGVGKAIATASGESKKLLFSLSPFHLVQEGVRSFMAGVNPFSIKSWNIEGNPLLRAGVEHGLTLNPAYDASELFSEGLSGGGSKIISKVPLLRDINNFTHDLIFKKYVPAQKAAAFEQLVPQYRRAYPGWSDEKIYTEAAAHTNELFGGINWKYLGRSARSQDLMRLASLSPDWSESNLRLLGRTLGPTGAVARRQLAKLAVTTWLAARIVNQVTSGQWHNETPFGVAVKDDSGKEHVYTLRSPITDALHLAQDPRSFLLNRLSPAVKSGVEIATGRDIRGRAVTPGDSALNAISNATPIPAQGALHFFTNEGPDRDGFAQVLQSFGAENYLYKTAAEKLAAQLASNRNPSGPVDSQQLALHQSKLRAEDELRAGQQPDPALFAPKDWREIVRNSRMTELQARFARLPMRDALAVWDTATNDEKAQLTQEFLRKKNLHLRSRYNEPPQARALDPVYRRIVQMFPEGATAALQPLSPLPQ